MNPRENLSEKMFKNGILLLVVLTMLSGCGFFKKKPPPPPPEPTRVVLEFETTGDINPNLEGRASPLVLRIYQLKSYSAFSKADFFSLYEKDDQLLGGDLIKKEEIILKPAEKRTIHHKIPDDTRAIGLLGAFRNYEEAEWRAIAGVHPNITNVINIHVSGIKLTVR